MGSNDVITVHQSVLGRCVCPSADVTSLPDPEDVARNLLSGFRDSERLRLVPSRDFKPWYDESTLTQLHFKVLPPELMLIPNLKSNPSSVERQGVLSTSDNLLEFSPVYSDKSRLKHAPLKKGDNKSGSDDEERETCNSHPARQHSPWSIDCSKCESGKSKLLQEALNPINLSAKSLWCASPSHISSRKRKVKENVLEKFKETDLLQVKQRYGLDYHQRGKWIICAKMSSFKEKSLTVEQLWKEVCLLIKEGHLPHCNAKLQRLQDEVWVYCDFEHSLKVRSTLEKALGNFGLEISFVVYPVGVVMEL